MILQHRKERQRFLKFALVGSMGAAVDFAVFNFLTQVAGLPPLLSSVFSFLTAMTHNFLWHRHWTFPESRSKRAMHQWAQFGAVSAVGLGIRTLLFSLIHAPLVALMAHFVPPLPLTPTFWGNNLSLAVVILTVMVWNFFANRVWTYNDVALGA